MRIASLLLWLTGPALAAPVELPCPYEAGATHRWAKQSVGAAGEVEQLVSVTVAEATEALVTFEVQAELERVEARDPVLVHMTRALAAQGIRPRVVLDRAAGTLALANGAELQPAYVAAGEAAVAALEAEGAPESVRKVVPQLVADPALMEQSVIRDLTPLLALGWSRGSSATTPPCPAPSAAPRSPPRAPSRWSTPTVPSRCAMSRPSPPTPSPPGPWRP